jgi:hypothetical protein
MKYILVENNEIKSYPRELPTSWGNISNFNVLDDVFLKTFGWYPYRFVAVDLFDNMIVDGSYTVVEENEVVEYQIDSEIEALWGNIRNRRNMLLNECDWTQLPDSPLTEEKKLEWKVYRQDLRDITNQEDPHNIIWPTKPDGIQSI